MLDVHLGRLAGYMRLLGIDTAYGPAWTDTRLQRIAAMERRVLLTRDVALLKRKDVPAGAPVHATDARAGGRNDGTVRSRGAPAAFSTLRSLQWRSGRRAARGHRH